MDTHTHTHLHHQQTHPHPHPHPHHHHHHNHLNHQYRNLTNEMHIDKIGPKETIHQTVDQSTDHLAQHVVVVSELHQTSSNQHVSPNGLTVRSHSPSKDIVGNQGSSLSLNGPEEATESIASHDHNYKSSSESGRGTMNSHLDDERSPIQNTTPSDLTSLDSDQSHPEPTDWKVETSANGATTAAANYHKIQRYLDDQRTATVSAKEAAAIVAATDLAKEFKAKMNVTNGVDHHSHNGDRDDSDSWTSLSDHDPPGMIKKNTTKKTSTCANQPAQTTKSGTTTKSTGKQSGNNNNNNNNNNSKHRNQVQHLHQTELKTNFSKPENCMAVNH